MMLEHHKRRATQPGVVQPMALGVVTDEIRRAITIGERSESDGIDAFPLA